MLLLRFRGHVFHFSNCPSFPSVPLAVLPLCPILSFLLANSTVVYYGNKHVNEKKTDLCPWPMTLHESDDSTMKLMLRMELPIWQILWKCKPNFFLDASHYDWQVCVVGEDPDEPKPTVESTGLSVTSSPHSPLGCFVSYLCDLDTNNTHSSRYELSLSLSHCW